MKEMLLALLLLIIGFVLLIKGADLVGKKYEQLMPFAKVLIYLTLWLCVVYVHYLHHWRYQKIL